MFKNIPIQRKLITVMLLTCGAVLLLTCSLYFAYEYITFRQVATRQLSTLGKIIATNCTAALAFDSQEESQEILAALKAEPHIIGACLYDKNAKLFSYYPSGLSKEAFPGTPLGIGYQLKDAYLEGYESIKQGDKVLGTLYLRSDMGVLDERLASYAVIAFLVFSFSFMMAFFLSKTLQHQISGPIISLANTAKIVSEHKDYGLRAGKVGEDELGILTDSFNHMLSQIENQNIILTKNKEYLENIVQSMGDAYVSLNSQWQYTFANKKALTLMGKSEADLLGRKIWEVFPDMVDSIFYTTYQQVMNSRISSSFETHYASYDMWLEIRAYPHEDGIAIFYTDISKYKKAEEEIRGFNQNLEQKVLERTNELQFANKELEAFSYSVSHDLRAPLRSIHGYINIFNEDYAKHVDKEGQRLINIIMTNAKRMGLLIDDLLEFSRLGRKELKKMRITMKDMVSNICSEMHKENGRNAEFILKELPDAMADTIIKQVWYNLISNAYKYTGRVDKAVIEIGCSQKTDSIIYYVKDNGAGFDMTYYDKLFGVFQRLHAQHEFEGTGVGLAIVQRIVAKHGGQIWADAKPNQGATFYFSLPYYS